jgi:hypothetical protein
MSEYCIPETANYKCYKINKILYVPHYNNPGVYVGPSVRENTGFIKGNYVARYFYKHELIKMGATEVIEQLWSTSARDQK